MCTGLRPAPDRLPPFITIPSHFRNHFVHTHLVVTSQNMLGVLQRPLHPATGTVATRGDNAVQGCGSSLRKSPQSPDPSTVGRAQFFQLFYIDVHRLAADARSFTAFHNSSFLRFEDHSLTQSPLPRRDARHLAPSAPPVPATGTVATRGDMASEHRGKGF